MVSSISRNDAVNVGSRRLLFVASEDYAFLQHRLPFAFAARGMGINVHVAAPDNGHLASIAELGFTVHSLGSGHKRLNILTAFKTLCGYVRIYLKVRPNIVHHSSVRVCILGTLAAKSLPGAKLINAFTGLGFLFANQGDEASAMRRIVFPLLRGLWADSRITPLFQNQDDFQELLKLGLCRQDPSFIAGSGIDVRKFRPAHQRISGDRLVLGCASRLVRDKGLAALIDAMRVLGEKRPNIELLIAGDIAPNNPTSFTKSDVEVWQKLPNVKVMGYQKEMISFWARCNAAILPSHREGMPKALLEAASMGLPLLASDVPGCRDIVRHGENGLLFGVDDVDAIVRAIMRMADDLPFREAAGKRSRAKVISDGFSVDAVSEAYKHLLFQLIG